MIIFCFIFLTRDIYCESLGAKSELYYAGSKLESGLGYYSHAYGIPGVEVLDQ